MCIIGKEEEDKFKASFMFPYLVCSCHQVSLVKHNFKTADRLAEIFIAWHWQWLLLKIDGLWDWVQQHLGFETTCDNISVLVLVLVLTDGVDLDLKYHSLHLDL